MTPLLMTKGLSRHYGGLKAVDGVDFAVMPGEIRAIIGPNGAGKTTFVSLVCGRVEPSAGMIVFDGSDITDMPPHRRVRRGIAYTFQITSVFANLSAYDNIALPVQRTLIVPPTSRIGSITDEERVTIRSRSPVGGKYDTAIDRESAAEILAKRTAEEAATAPIDPTATSKTNAAAEKSSGWGKALHDMFFGNGRRQGVLESLAKSAARNAGGQLGRSILRGVLGSISRK